MQRLPLRWRVALAYGLIGMMLSLGFAVVTFYVAEDYEHIIVEALITGEFKDYSARLQEVPDLPLPHTPSYSVYREAEAPTMFQHLSDGVHEPEVEQHEGIHVAAYGAGDQRLIFVLDLGGIEQREEYLEKLMLMVVLGGTLISGWLGWMLSGRTIAPVMRLAESLDALPTRPERTHLAEQHGPDEIGRLAGAIDAYQQRLVDADAKERAFFADASHELRTPIAVIQGAVEVLQDDPEASAGQRQRLARVDRGILELAGLLEALLLSARGLPEHTDAIDLAACCRVALARQQGQARIALAGEGPVDLRAPRRWVDCILGVLFQRLLAFAPGAAWQCTLDARGLLLHRPGEQATAAGASGRSDLGIGLIFIDRLCRELGWRLSQQIDEHGLRIRLDLEPAASA